MNTYKKLNFDIYNWGTSTDGMEWMKGIKDNFNDLFKKLASRIR